MSIRRLLDADRATFQAIRLELFPEDEGLEWPVDELLSTDAVAFGAFDGQLVGYAAARFRSHAEGAWDAPATEQRIAYLEEWYVRESHRRRGIGGSLVVAIEGWARDHGATHLASDTDLDNRTSIAAHEALGLREVERAVHFVKKLQPAPEGDSIGRPEAS